MPPLNNSDVILHQHWLLVIESRGVNLTPWEEDFTASLQDRLNSGRTLTDSQAEILERIYTEKTP